MKTIKISKLKVLQPDSSVSFICADDSIMEQFIGDPGLVAVYTLDKRFSKHDLTHNVIIFNKSHTKSKLKVELV